ncbi:hypothetical protein SERLA73DRAFT_137520 [Serpula lacrymans var. lacrymans S7.3]|uniref:Uncharacterized protein n=2 Tax=Serpula lacrymans var. lacrymans TaxID=341189 RepID=F8PWT1_SERL3|nr:uncharacterized protein SERLADRAFT_390678 [Serpula lacrymans var. lacrymans S7.9]EGN99258.1 hypothetical protein SERLA73DRAFT_137520 [Serpula lacrymans var. lacrymans S7.3]EGO24823.1 hypothetical protein SERLADRAFT_390678 [Serpula lacrymans var. lacrymans S7.9]
MKSVFISLVSVALLVAGAVAQSFTINTPANVVECQPTLLQWSGGTGPYYLSILPGSSPGSAALEDLGQQSGTSVTWTCNIAAGTSIGLTLRDSTGATAQSAPFTVNPGSSSCLNSTSTAAGSSASSPVNSASSTGSGSAATTASSTSGGATTGTSSAAPTTTSTNAAPAKAAQFGVAGVLGAAAAALLL